MAEMLGREDLLSKDDLEVRKVEFKDGNYVFVRQMTGRERDRFEQSIVDIEEDVNTGKQTYKQNLEDFRAKLAVNTVCDEEGELVFKPTDYTQLSKNLSAAKLEKIVNVAQRLNAITEEDKEDLVTTSEPGQKENSTSG